MSNKYEDMVAAAAGEFAAARAEYATVAAAAREAEGALAELRGEAAAIGQRIAEFEAGRAMIDADEFIRLADRKRWLEVRVRQQAAIAKQAAGNVALGAERPRGVAGKYRAQLERMLEEDARAVATARRSELAEVLRG